VAQALARYDEFAEWYQRWIGDAPPLIAAHSGLLPAVAGQRVLDIACGQGRMSRYLAGRGADVVGVDISAAMLGKARAASSEDIAYVRADVTWHPAAWWDGRPFDGCTCELALMDIDDLAGTLSTVTTVLRPGGWFVASIMHPCFPGSEVGRSSWPPGQGYESEGWWTSPDHNPEGVRIRVGATHRKLSTFLNALLDAGLEAERFVEPAAPVPTYLLWRCRRR